MRKREQLIQIDHGIQRKESDINTQFSWPPNEPKTIDNFSGFKVTAFQEMFGSLDDTSPLNPFSRISVANSSFSIDPTVGCPETCHYCVRLSNARDSLVNKDGNIEIDRAFATPVTKLFSGKTLIENLSQHPAFIKNESVISISTGSSEAFAKISSDETWDIFKTLMKLNLKNPVWIVTKFGIPHLEIKKWEKRFKDITKTGIPVVLSITSTGMPKHIEKNQRDRFKFVESLKDAGIHISHHLRPIIKDMNDSPEIIREQLERALPLVESVCLGGLRADPGIIIAWQEVGDLDMSLLPSKVGEKDLPKNLEITVRKIMDELGYQDTPLFMKSSHSISHAVGINDFNLYEYRPKNLLSKNHLLTIPHKISLELKKNSVSLLKLADAGSKRIGLADFTFKIKVLKNGDIALICEKDISDYRIHRSLIHSIGHLNILPTNIYDTQKFN